MKKQRGYLIMMALAVIILIGVVCRLLFSMLVTQIESSLNSSQETAAFYLANSALEVIKRELIVNKTKPNIINTKYGKITEPNQFDTLNGQYLANCATINIANNAGIVLAASITATDTTIPLNKIVIANSILQTSIAADNIPSEITLATTDDFPKSGTLKIDDEFIIYNNKQGNKLLEITRAAVGSFPQAHNVGATVTYGLIPKGLVIIDEEIIEYNGIVDNTLQAAVRRNNSTYHNQNSPVTQSLYILTCAAGLPTIANLTGGHVVTNIFLTKFLGNQGKKRFNVPTNLVNSPLLVAGKKKHLNLLMTMSLNSEALGRDGDDEDNSDDRENDKNAADNSNGSNNGNGDNGKQKGKDDDNEDGNSNNNYCGIILEDNSIVQTMAVSSPTDPNFADSTIAAYSNVCIKNGSRASTRLSTNEIASSADKINDDILENQKNISATHLFSYFFKNTDLRSLKNYCYNNGVYVSKRDANRWYDFLNSNSYPNQTIFVDSSVSLNQQQLTFGTPSKPSVVIINGNLSLKNRAKLTVHGLLFVTGRLSIDTSQQNPATPNLDIHGYLADQKDIALKKYAYISLSPQDLDLDSLLPTNPYLNIIDPDTESNDKSGDRGGGTDSPDLSYEMFYLD